MRRFFVLACLVLGMSSCSTEYQSRQINEVQIESYELVENSGIRAIHATDTTKVYFGSSYGYGYFENDKIVHAAIKYQDSIPLHFRSIAFNGKDHFLLSIGNPAVLYKSVFDSKKVVYTESHEKVFYDSMKFFDEMNGIAMGDPTEDCLSIILTHDGGETWTKIPCNKLPKITEGEAAFAASNTNVALFENHAWLASGGSKARVFHSADYGRSWDVYSTPMQQGGKMTGIFSMDFYDQERGIIFGGNWEDQAANNGNKAVSIDGGITWSLLTDGDGPGYRSCVQFISGSNAKGIFAVGIPGISYSADGGLTWQHIDKKDFYTIRLVPNKNIAWLAGKGKIAKMTW